MKKVIIILIILIVSGCAKNAEELVLDTIPFTVKQFNINDNELFGTINKINVIDDYNSKNKRVIETIIYMEVDGISIESHVDFIYEENNLVSYDYKYNIKNVKDIPNIVLSKVLDKYPDSKISIKRCDTSNDTCFIKYDVKENNKYISYTGDISIDAMLNIDHDINNKFNWDFDINSNIIINHHLNGLFNNKIMELKIENDNNDKIVASGRVNECEFNNAYDIICNNNSCEFNIKCHDVYTIKIYNDKILVNDLLLYVDSR